LRLRDMKRLLKLMNALGEENLHYWITSQRSPNSEKLYALKQ